MDSNRSHRAGIGPPYHTILVVGQNLLSGACKDLGFVQGQREGQILATCKCYIHRMDGGEAFSVHGHEDRRPVVPDAPPLVYGNSAHTPLSEWKSMPPRMRFAGGLTGRSRSMLREESGVGKTPWRTTIFKPVSVRMRCPAHHREAGGGGLGPRAQNGHLHPELGERCRLGYRCGCVPPGTIVSRPRGP